MRTKKTLLIKSTTFQTHSSSNAGLFITLQGKRKGGREGGRERMGWFFLLSYQFPRGRFSLFVWGSECLCVKSFKFIVHLTSTVHFTVTCLSLNSSAFDCVKRVRVKRVRVGWGGSMLGWGGVGCGVFGRWLRCLPTIQRLNLINILMPKKLRRHWKERSRPDSSSGGSCVYLFECVYWGWVQRLRPSATTAAPPMRRCGTLGSRASGSLKIA